MRSDIPILDLISDHLDRQVELRPDQDFLVHYDTRLSYAATKAAVDLTAKMRRERYEEELRIQRYHQRRNRQSRKSHTKTRIAQLDALGIDVERIKSCIT